MATTEVATVVSTKKLESILVEPVISKPVPDHLTGTKVFTKLAKNEIFHAKPATLHFEGFYVGRTQKKTLQLTNVSRDNQRLHIIPPATPIFIIHYIKRKNTVAPGFHLDVTVEFKPKEWKYYYDCLKIHCKGGENLYVPLHAYPVMNTKGFPRTVTFPATPLGESSKKTVSLCSDVPVDFEFQLMCSEPHTSFHVTPMQGIVPAHGKICIAVTFKPTEFSTAIMKLELKTSQFNSYPIECTFIGYSTPGLSVMQATETEGIPLPPLEKLKMKRKQLKMSKKSANKATAKSIKSNKEIVYKGLRFPSNINTPNAVSKVLNQQAGKLKASELKAPRASNSGIGSRQMKEAAFIQEVRCVADEERSNQLRWVTHLGSHLMDDLEKQDVLTTRTQLNKAYEHYRRVPVVRSECSRSITECCLGRTFRDTSQDQWPDARPKFAHYSTDNWAQRHMVQQRFIQAARKIIIRQRCKKKLVYLKEFIDDWKKGKFVAAQQMVGTEKIEEENEFFSMATSLILPSSFPSYQPEKNEVEDISTGTVGHKPFTISSISSIDLMELRVPQHSKLLGYEQQTLPLAGVYIPPDAPRSFRIGAKEETVLLEGPRSFRIGAKEETVLLEGPTEADLSPSAEGAVDSEEKVYNLSPPKALFLPSPNHPLHILGCEANVTVCVTPLPHCETDVYHALLPIPKYPTERSKRKFDHQDVIPGIMKWKQFSSPFLSSVEASKTLSTEWVPRWSQHYSLLQEEPPDMMTGPSPNDYYKESDISSVPTPDIVKQQFSFPKDNEIQDARSIAKERIVSQNQEHLNQFGKQIKDRLQQMNSLLLHTQLPANK